MTRVAREFENLILAVRSSVAANRPASCELLDNLIDKTKKCFADQKRTLYKGLACQIIGPAVVTGVAAGYYKADTVKSLEWGSKAGEVFKTWFDSSGYDHQTTQKHIDSVTAELTAANQGQATFLQSLETAMQRHQQILDNAKR